MNECQHEFTGLRIFDITGFFVSSFLVWKQIKPFYSNFHTLSAFLHLYMVSFSNIRFTSYVYVVSDILLMFIVHSIDSSLASEFRHPEMILESKGLKAQFKL